MPVLSSFRSTRTRAEPGERAGVRRLRTGGGRQVREKPAPTRFFYLCLKKWWCPGPESNQRHADFQSAALPTELPGPGRRHRCAAPRSAGLIEARIAPVQRQLASFAQAAGQRAEVRASPPSRWKGKAFSLPERCIPGRFRQDRHRERTEGGAPRARPDGPIAGRPRPPSPYSCRRDCSVRNCRPRPAPDRPDRARRSPSACRKCRPPPRRSLRRNS